MRNSKDLPEAHEILSTLSSKEFPFVWGKALEFALFKTYAVPSISSLLVRTGELVHNCAYRVEATDLLVRHFSERAFFVCPSARAALDRMNAIHGQFTISNGDMLFTLAAFVCEPTNWVDRYEWRKLTPHEQDAVHTYWSAVGHEMGIQNIPESYQETMDFYNRYADEHVRYTEGNARVAAATMDLLLDTEVCPPPFSFLKPAVRPCLHVFLDKQYGDALGIPRANAAVAILVTVALRFRALVIRLLFWPRARALVRTAPAAGPIGVVKPVFPAFANVFRNGYAVEELGNNGRPVKARE